MSDNTNADECYCEETALDGESTCQLCRDLQAAERQADRTTNALIHYITGGDFL